MAYLWAGPEGNGQPFLDAEQSRSPATEDYRKKVVEYQKIAAENGDRSALLGMSIREENENRDYYMSLAYWVAQEQVSLARGGAPGKSYSNVVVRMSQHLSSEQVALAIEEGKRIARTAQASPYWNQQ